MEKQEEKAITKDLEKIKELLIKLNNYFIQTGTHATPPQFLLFGEIEEQLKALEILAN